MGQYKVPQDVESEDKILGPLSLKQFIYAIIGVGYGLLTFAIFKPVPAVWVIVGLPPMLFMLALGLYQRKDQPFESFFVGVLQFLFRPRKRYWEKEPIAEVFRVEPRPPKPRIARRDPREVRGQLQRLADVVDTRGWSNKQPELQEPQDETYAVDLSDRIGATQIVDHSPVTLTSDITQADDILDDYGDKAAGLNVLIENTVQNIRQEALDKMRNAPVAPAAASPPPVQAPAPVPVDSSNAIIKLATEGGDLTVAQLASQASRNQGLVEGQAISLRGAVN